MDKKTADSILDKYLRVAHSKHDDVRLTSRVARLTTALFREGIFVGIESAVSTKLAGEIHEELNKHLAKLAEGKASAVKLLNTVEMGGQNHPDTGKPFTVINLGGRAQGVIAALYIVMHGSGSIKKVIKCPGCGKYFFRTKGARKTCSDRCRKRISDENLSEEKLAERKKKRSKRYRK